MTEENSNYSREDIYSKAVRAGKRTYFFDVKSTRGNDLYLTITESKKRFHEDGRHSYEKHKLFLYKEDFEKFSEGLQEAISMITDLKENNEIYQDQETEEKPAVVLDGSPRPDMEKQFTDINFEDLDQVKS